MKGIWNFFASVKLTIALTVVICLDAAWGSIVTVKSPGFSRALDQSILFPWLLSTGPKYPELSLWIYILVFLMAVFTVNTVVCTADKVYSIVKGKRPWQSFFPHIVHIGFMVALVGHLAGSAGGFRSYGTTVMQGETVPVPHVNGLSIRLDGVEMTPSPSGDIESLKTRVTLLEGGTEVKKGVIEINGPLVYNGVAYYHMDQGRTPTGFILEIDGEPLRLNMNSPSAAKSGMTYRLGDLYPDFALDPEGRPASRSEEFRNPYIEVVSGGGNAAYLPIGATGGQTVLDGKVLTLQDYIISPYVVLTINRDPGIWFIIIGSSILVAGMVLLLLFRGERGELLRQRKDGAGQEGA
ncbi:MAG: cytochrome c biogenesis protein ResB [Deltaproteobacteria bacterium]|nr:cytochrome c biogenesis protein ResB [Deltaproteobacteria bacterium]